MEKTQGPKALVTDSFPSEVHEAEHVEFAYGGQNWRYADMALCMNAFTKDFIKG